MKNFLKAIKDTKGATAIEYGLLAALIGVAMIAGASALGTTLNSKFSAIGVRIGTGATTAATQ